MGDYIDTRTGSPITLVDETGYGWFLALILIATPFVVLMIMIENISNWVSTHLILSFLIYIIFSFVIAGTICFVKRPINKIPHIVAMVISFAPFYAFNIFLLFPYVRFADKFDAFITFTILNVIAVIITVGVIYLSCVSDNGYIHLLVGGIFLVVSIFITRAIIKYSTVVTHQSLLEFYHISTSKWFECFLWIFVP